MTFKIFVSYSSNDLKQAKLLDQQLVNTPIDVFIADDAIKPSQALTSEIEVAIRNCDMFVVLWSDNAKTSDWVQQEIGKADAFGKTILPLVLTPGLTLPGFISHLKHFEVRDHTAIVKAGEMIVDVYNKKQQQLARQQAVAQRRRQNEQDAMAKMRFGAFLLWALSR